MISQTDLQSLCFADYGKVLISNIRAYYIKTGNPHKFISVWTSLIVFSNYRVEIIFIITKKRR